LFFFFFFFVFLSPLFSVDVPAWVEKMKDETKKI